MRISVYLLALPLAAQAPDFAKSVYSALERAQCRACHNDNGVASASRLRFPPEDASGEEVARFGQSLAVLVNRGDPAASLLVRKPTNRVPHPGGERIKQGSAEEKVLEQWAAHLASLPATHVSDSGPRRAIPVVLRRLTHAQYDNTVEALLGDRTRPASRFPQEDIVNGFTNQASGQSISPLMAEDYARAAARLARNAGRGGALARFVQCQPKQADCGEHFVREFGEAAFRRPLSAEELQTFTRLLGTNFDTQTVAEAMLQSPGFLFHTGTGVQGTAAKLSYLLWNGPPDVALRQAAKDGHLNTPAQIAAEARRLLADPRAREAMNQFLAEWLRFDRVRGALRERKLFPEFGPELIQAMVEETSRLFGALVWEDRNFLEFFTAEYSYLNTPLAALYGVDPPAREFDRVSLPAGGPRAGVLGHASLLTLTSKPAETAPTERGLFLREHFLCQIVPPPPPGVSTTLPVVESEKPMTNRERLAVHLSSPSCASCHRLVDPIGFGFEQFDAIGRFREKQIALVFPTEGQTAKNTRRDGIRVELAVDTRASIVGVPGSEFASPAEAGRILARTPACQRCIVKQFFRYALGRAETEADQPHIDAIYARFRDSGFRFRELILAVVTSRPFLEDSRNAH